MKGITGGSLGGYQVIGERRRKRRARARAREEERWADQAGPVLIRIGDREIYAKSQAKADIAAARRILLAAIDADASEGSVRSPS